MNRDDYIAESKARADAAIAVGADTNPITTWQELADLCGDDDVAWQSILDALGPKSRAEALAVRPASSAGQESAA